MHHVVDVLLLKSLQPPTNAVLPPNPLMLCNHRYVHAQAAVACHTKRLPHRGLSPASYALQVLNQASVLQA
jgi:hypothetical protein